ncbi:hypothetical protein R4315_32650, partial [Rhodococcus oxybenzonivorans]
MTGDTFGAYRGFRPQHDVVLVIDAAVIVRGGGDEGFSTAAFHPAEFFSGAPGIALIFAIAG